MSAYESVPVDGLITHPDNPRRGDVEAVASSIQSNGFYGAIVAQRSTRYVLAGNHRLRAARALGMTEVPVIWLDCDDDRAKRILIADNRSSDLATWDNPTLIALLKSFDDLEGTLFDDEALAALSGQLLPPGDADSVDIPMAWGVIVEVDDEASQADLLARLASEGYRIRALMS